MAYTYDDFVSAANSAGMMGEFSEYDLQTARNDPEYGLSILRLKQDAANATTAEQRLLANEAADQLRSAYGSRSAGTGYQNQIDGLNGRIDSYASFDYQGQDAYDKLLAGVVDRQPFSYDPEADPSWGAYRKAYLREGDRASANAMAQAAAASGGRPSSYAMTAAQQAGNYYAGQLADMLPTLEQDAYSRYMDELNALLSSLNAIQSDRDTNYQEWMDQYQMLQNSLGNYQTQAATEYQKYLDSIDRQYREQQMATQLAGKDAGTGDGGVFGAVKGAFQSIPSGLKQETTDRVDPGEDAGSYFRYEDYLAKKEAMEKAGKVYTTSTAQAFINGNKGYEFINSKWRETGLDTQTKALIEQQMIDHYERGKLTDEDIWIIDDYYGLGLKLRM